MHPTRRRIVGSIAIAIPFAAIMMRGALRTDDKSVWAMMGIAAGIAIIFYLMWPVFEYTWKDGVPNALTWKRFAGLTVVGLLITIVIVLGARVIGHDLDPWLVLGYVMLIVMLSFVGSSDMPIRVGPRR
jgi:hypothetical protein